MPRQLSLIRLKVVVIAVFAIVYVVGFSGLTGDFAGVSASRFGPSASFTGAPGESNCTACHSTYPVNSGSGRVSISGLPARYTPGQQVQVTVTTSQSDAIIYGFQLTALDASGHDAGAIALPSGTPERIQTITGLVNGIVRTYVEHTADGVTPTQGGLNSWTFTWTAPAQDVGPVTFYAAGNAANSDGSTTDDYIYTASKTVFSRSLAPADFDGDLKTDVSIFRTPVAEWWIRRSSTGQTVAGSFGSPTDVITPGDFTGDGKNDSAFFRPATGEWFVFRSEDNTYYSYPFGLKGDIPMPADYDADGKTDTALFRPSQGTWFVLQSGGGPTIFFPFGANGDQPVAADYDGDGRADFGIVRNNSTTGNKEWWIQRSTEGILIVNFGNPADKTIVGDYTGDGRADIAFFRPSNGEWFVFRSEDFSYFSFPWGQAGDQPVPGDYDGDGKFDAAVFRPSDRTWYLLSSSGSGPMFITFGAATDALVPAAYVR